MLGRGRASLLAAIVAVLVALGLATYGVRAVDARSADDGVEAVPQFPAVEGLASDAPDPADRPNIVFVLTDDQNDDDLAWMPHTQRLLVEQGIDFEDNVSPHPLCCPARVEMLTGRYAQNNGVLHNGGPYGGYQAFDPTQSIAQRFGDAGYTTGLVGKYLNGYPSDAPADPGWDLWEPLVRGVYDYERYTFFGEQPSWRRDRAPYVTDSIARRTNDAVRRLARSEDPFLLYSWHVAPHYRPVDGIHRPPPGAPRDRDKFGDVAAPSLAKPNYNQEDVSDQPEPIRKRPVISDAKNVSMFRGRIRSLQSVDRAVASLVRTLRATGELDDTYIVFASDNGYAMGEHRLFGKNVLTEQILGVPLVIRGPGIAPGTTSGLPTSLVDLPATMLDLAGIDDVAGMDGQSLAAPATGAPAAFRDTTLVQTGDTVGDGWAYRGVRTERYLYGRHQTTGDAFLYDRARDPWELDNVVDDPAYAGVRGELERRTAALLECDGEDCNLRFGPDPAPAAGATPTD